MINHWAAQSIWMIGVELFHQHQRLSALAKTLPTELRVIKRRSTSLSIALFRFGEVLRDDQFRVLEPYHKSNEDVLPLVEEVQKALFEIIRGIQNHKDIPRSGVWDSIASCLGLSSAVDQWHMKNKDLISETEEISFALANINHVVTASNARKASEIHDGVGQLQMTVQRLHSLITSFGSRLQRQPLRKAPVSRSTAADIGRRAKAHVDDLCSRNETYYWHRFLDDTSALILVGEVGNEENIIAFFVWYAENGKETEFFKVDKERPFLTCPGNHRNEATIFVSKEPRLKEHRITLYFCKADDAYDMRELIDQYERRFTGYISDAECRQDARGRYKALAGLSRSRGFRYVAEVLVLDTTPNKALVLQLWPHHGSQSAVGTEPVYIHEVQSEASYEVQEQTLRLRGAKVTRTKYGIGHLRGQRNMDCDELTGDFKIHFRESKEASKVYNLLNIK